MAYTEKRYEGALYPFVDFTVLSGGAVRARFEFDREKKNGDVEHIVVTFPDLNEQDLACIGAKARKAVWHSKDVITKRLQAAYDRMITPGS